MQAEALGFCIRSSQGVAEMEKIHDKYNSIVNNEQGAIGYILAWFMGVPVVVLAIIFVLRGFT